MADKKITELPAASLPIATGVKFEAVQGGINVQVDADDMPGSGAAGVTSVSGTADRITSTGGATPVINISATFEALLQKLVNTAVALTDAASMDLTAIKHTLTTSSATRTFTISYTGDDITLEVTLNATSSVFTFPATALCVSDGLSSGDNTCTLAGVSGDKYIIAIKKIGSAYYVVAKNFGQ